MSMILVWVLNVIASLGLDVYVKFEFLKYIASEGYKIDLKKLKEASLKQEKKKSSFFVPLVNIYKALGSLERFINKKEEKLEELKSLNCLIPFTEEETKKYKSSPRAKTAIKISNDFNSKPVEEPIDNIKKEEQSPTNIPYTAPVKKDDSLLNDKVIPDDKQVPYTITTKPFPKEDSSFQKEKVVFDNKELPYTVTFKPFPKEDSLDYDETSSLTIKINSNEGNIVINNEVVPKILRKSI